MQYVKRGYFFVLACIASCTSVVPVNDVKVSGYLEQSFSLEQISSLTIRCYCPEHSVIRDVAVSDLTLKVKGTFDSVGYHGEQEPQESMPTKFLAFVPEKKEETLILVSREYVYLHHANRIDKLEVILPPGVDVDIQLLTYEELINR